MVSPISYQTYASQSSSDSQLAVDQFCTMLCVEESYRVPFFQCESLSSSSSSSSSSNNGSDRHPYADWRRKICQWSFKVIDHFKIDREIVSSAMNIFDRYLALSGTECLGTIDSQTFQLAAMSSLYLAMKVADSGDDHSACWRKLRLQSFVELSRGQFCADDITATERTILKVLGWKIYPPTPMTAVSYLLRLMPSYMNLPHTCQKSYDLVLHVIHELSRYLTELSVCLGSVSISHTPSQVAYASILLSMELLTSEALPMQVRDAFNEAVVSTSSLSGGTILTPNDEVIQSLQERLRHSFWPEMLMEDCESAEVGHPISMAKDFGLLDVSSIMSSATMSPQANYYSYQEQHQMDKNDLEGSPVCVSRQF